MIVKNIGYNAIEAGVNTQHITINGGETKEIPDNIAQVILNSYRAPDLQIIERSLNASMYLRMEEV